MTPLYKRGAKGGIVYVSRVPRVQELSPSLCNNNNTIFDAIQSYILVLSHNATIDHFLQACQGAP